MRDYGGVPGEVIETEIQDGIVTGVKSSPHKGKRRIMARSKTGSRKAFTVDIPFKEADDIERKKAYSFDVYEKEDDGRYGGMQRASSSKMKSYLCDEKPELYSCRSKSQFKNFGSSGESSSRTKF